MVLAIGVPIALWTRTQLHYEHLFPPDHVSFARQLASPQFENATYAVDSYAAVVAYYAGTWAYMDTAIENPQEDAAMRRRQDVSSIWFADWRQNPAYSDPKYYVCMKPQTFDSVLAEREPTKFRDRFQFCGDEPILAHNLSFDDRLAAGDAIPPRYWAVIGLSLPLPKVVDVITSPVPSVEELQIGYEVRPATNPAYPVQSEEVELWTAADAHSCSDIGKLQRATARPNWGKFQLPKDFVGIFEVRARVKSQSGYSDWAGAASWLYNGDKTRGILERCPEILVDSSFGANGLNLQATGWSTPEPWGTWSDGKFASLAPIPLPQAVKNRELLLKVDVRPLIAKPGQTQIARVSANGIVVANWLFTAANPERTAVAIIPRRALEHNDSLALSFELPEAVSPASFGLSQDTRKLGIGIEHIEIRELLPSDLRHISFTRPQSDFDALATAGWKDADGS